MRVGIAHHFGWAIAVVTSDAFAVVVRRRIDLVEADVSPAPIHYEGGPNDRGVPLTDEALAALVDEVRASAARATTDALRALGEIGPIESCSVRAWPAEFPRDVATQRRVPYESRADSVMYCQVLASAAERLGWAVHLYNAGDVESQARRVLGERAAEVLDQRAALGPPWTKDHRIALAATVLAQSGR